jgi:DNA polymerase-3 subunit epsilon
MSIYLRTSVRLGPLRVRVSPSGIGATARIPGLRVGTGPRGGFVRVDTAGVRYRSTTGGRRPPVLAGPGERAEAPFVMTDLTGARAETLSDADPGTLVGQLNAASHAHRLWPWALVGSLLLAAATPWLLIPGALLTVWLFWRDQVRRAVVVFYEVDGPAHARFQALLDEFGLVCQALGAWQVLARGALRVTHQRKVHGGAGHLIRRHSLRRDVRGPAHLRTNVAVPSLHSPARSVFFLPDRILVRDGSTYADLPYDAVTAAWSEQWFIEDGAIPGDAQRVGTAWKFANMNGGPDRRFKNNRRLPILRYADVQLTGAGGFTVLWSFSTCASAQALAGAVSRLRW